MSNELTGYTFGTPSDVGSRMDLLQLDEVELLLDENIYDLMEDTVLLAGIIDDPEEDGMLGTVNRIEPWEELGLAFSYQELIKAVAKMNDAVDSINTLGNSEEYRFPTYSDDMKETRLPAGYPSGEALTGYGLAYCLGAKLPESIGERFDFYASYQLVKHDS